MTTETPLTTEAGPEGTESGLPAVEPEPAAAEPEPAAAEPTAPDHELSVVIPVYQGEHHLPALIEQIVRWGTSSTSPDGHPFRVVEILLVNDCGPDRSPEVMRRLEDEHDLVRSIWLSRNFGQHAATLAGMASSSGEWIVTMDEDGQHDPAFLGHLLDAALADNASVVYARPTNQAPHPFVRNLTSKVAKRVVNVLGGGVDASVFHSYRLILAEVGRSVAAYSGAGVYLDVALTWVSGTPTTAPVELRDEGERRSGYSLKTLASHFWRMVVSGGTRGLRVVSGVGIVFAIVGFVIALYLIINRLAGASLTQGWTSMIVVVLICSGITLFSLGVIAEYIGVAVNMAMGKPLYLIVSDPDSGPLGRRGRRR